MRIAADILNTDKCKNLANRMESDENIQQEDVRFVPFNTKLNTPSLKKKTLESLYDKKIKMIYPEHEEEIAEAYFKDDLIVEHSLVKKKKTTETIATRISLELIPKSWEDRYIRKPTHPKGGCCRENQCVGMAKLPVTLNIPGFILVRFRTPLKHKFDMCILCLREETTFKVVSAMRATQEGRPVPSITQPYRNYSTDYPSNVLIPILQESSFVGLSDPFVYFNINNYVLVGNDIVFQANTTLPDSLRYVF